MLVSLPHTGVISFTGAELEEATDNFSTVHLLGQGGFGKVFKGMFRHTTVAVKLLTKVKFSDIKMHCLLFFFNRRELILTLSLKHHAS